MEVTNVQGNSKNTKMTYVKKCSQSSLREHEKEKLDFERFLSVDGCRKDKRFLLLLTCRPVCLAAVTEDGRSLRGKWLCLCLAWIKWCFPPGHNTEALTRHGCHRGRGGLRGAGALFFLLC